MSNQIDFTINPITPVFGAEIKGISKTVLADNKVIEKISEWLDQYQVLVVRGIDLTPTELKTFTSEFGPLFVHHADEGVLLADDMPEVLEMRKEPEGERLFGGSDWHADVTFRSPAGLVSILNAKILPEVGGDTGFACTIGAFEALSEGLKNCLRGLKAVHSYSGPGLPNHPTETAIHPVVRKHPRTGREGLYVNRMFVSQFENMSYPESKPLIDFLDSHITRPEFTFRHKWQHNDLILWDNRFSLHYPINDFCNQRRLLIRCTALEQAA